MNQAHGGAWKHQSTHSDMKYQALELLMLLGDRFRSPVVSPSKTRNCWSRVPARTPMKINVSCGTCLNGTFQITVNSFMKLRFRIHRASLCPKVGVAHPYHQTTECNGLHFISLPPAPPRLPPLLPPEAPGLPRKSPGSRRTLPRAQLHPRGRSGRGVPGR